MHMCVRVYIQNTDNCHTPYLGSIYDNHIVTIHSVWLICRFVLSSQHSHQLRGQTTYHLLHTGHGPNPIKDAELSKHVRSRAQPNKRQGMYEYRGGA
jgi:hypothetical protein